MFRNQLLLLFVMILSCWVVATPHLNRVPNLSWKTPKNTKNRRIDTLISALVRDLTSVSGPIGLSREKF